MRAVLFDAAGTLIRLAEPVGETYVRFARAHGGEGDAARVDDAFRAALRAMPPMVFAGSPDGIAEERDWWRRVVVATFDAAAVQLEHRDRCFEDLFDHYAKPAAWRLAPGARKLLGDLRRRGLLTAVLSNFDRRLPAIFRGLEIHDLLDAVILPSDAGAAKPDPRIFRFALAWLKVEPRDAMYVGDDAIEDVAAARAVGMAAVDVTGMSDLRSVLDAIE